MKVRLSAVLALALLASACTSSSATMASESIPPAPVPPEGWASVGGLSGAAGAGFASLSVPLGSGVVALHAACSGIGTLIVLVSSEPAQAGVQPSAVFQCNSGTATENRFELTGVTIPRPTVFTVIVVEGLGAIRHSTFNVSIEQPTQP
jgi:hypothetical protein